MYMYLQKVISKKIFYKIRFFLASWEDQWRKWPDPDPLVRVMDPRIQIRIRIHPKMSWNRNTGAKGMFSRRRSWEVGTCWVHIPCEGVRWTVVAKTGTGEHLTKNNSIMILLWKNLLKNSSQEKSCISHLNSWVASRVVQAQRVEGHANHVADNC